MGPELSVPTRWIVTTSPGTGASPVTTGRTTRPSTIDGGVRAAGARGPSCAGSGAAAASARQATNRASLRIELPEVFGAQVLKVGLELIGGELRGIGPGLVRLVGRLADTRRVAAVVLVVLRRLDQQVVGGVDRRSEPQRDGDAVRRPGIDVDQRLAALDLQLGVVRALLDARDVDALELRPHPEDQVANEIVREGAHALHVVHVPHDRFGLGLADPDGEETRSSALLQHDDVGVRRAVQPEPRDDHFDHASIYPIRVSWFDAGGGVVSRARRA